MALAKFYEEIQIRKDESEQLDSKNSLSDILKESNLLHANSENHRKLNKKSDKVKFKIEPGKYRVHLKAAAIAKKLKKKQPSEVKLLRQRISDLEQENMKLKNKYETLKLLVKEKGLNPIVPS